jgi:hypothetical protein
MAARQITRFRAAAASLRSCLIGLERPDDEHTLTMDAAVRKPGALHLTPDLTVGDGLQEMLAGALGALQAQAMPAKTPTRDSVHRLRVGVRRLRSIRCRRATASRPPSPPSMRR